MITNRQFFDAPSIAQETSCVLGQWLLGDARQTYRHLDVYPACLVAHADFHLEAAEVARAINAQFYYEAWRMLGNGTAYSEASVALGVAITRMLRALAAAHGS